MSKRENPKKRERLTTLAENFNTFEERKRHLAFNFQFLTTGEGYGQSLEDWNKEGLLLDLNEKVNYRHPKGCQIPGFVENCFQHY